MVDFGYKIQADRQIDLDKTDKQLSEFIKKHEPSFNTCIACGGCTSTCTAGNFTQMNFRKMQLMIRRGETENVKKEIAHCMLCGKCQLVCPRGVNTRKIIMLIKQGLEAGL
jgi:heterodisulfide reductase subunit C